MFRFVPIDSCPVPVHYQNQPGSVHFALSIKIFICFNKIPPALLSLGQTVPAASVFSHRKGDADSVIFMALS